MTCRETEKQTYIFNNVVCHCYSRTGCSKLGWHYHCFISVKTNTSLWHLTLDSPRHNLRNLALSPNMCVIPISHQWRKKDVAGKDLEVNMIEQLFPQPHHFSCTVTLFPFHSRMERICDCEPFYNPKPDGPQFLTVP